MSKNEIRPKHVYILGNKIPISYKDRLVDDDGNEALGLYYTDQRKIEILNTLAPSEQVRILRHECMHAVLRLSGLTEHIPPKLEEQICVIMESVNI